jgi:hypothetical protein
MMSIIMPAVLSTIFIKPSEPKYLIRFYGAYDAYYYACGALIILTKPAELYDLLRSCGDNDVNYYPAALSTILTKPAELYDLLISCGANDVSYYPAVHPGCDKPCGAVRLTMGPRS